MAKKTNEPIFFLTLVSVTNPRLYRLKVVLRTDGEPLVTHVAQHALRIEFAHVGVSGKDAVALLECVDVLAVPTPNTNEKHTYEVKEDYVHLFGKAALAMSVPRDGAVCRVGPQTDPLFARLAEDAECFILGDVWVRAEVLYALLLRPLRPAPFRGRLGRRGRDFCRVDHHLCTEEEEEGFRRDRGMRNRRLG